MPRNGNGVYTLPAGNPVVTQTLITSTWANTTMTDLGAAITQSISKDGQTTPTGNLQMGGFRHTGVGDPASRTDYASLGYVQDGKGSRLTAISGVNQIVATLPGGATSLVIGMILQLIPVSNNTGAVTININNIGFVPLLTEGRNDLSSGNLVAGSPYILLYNGSQLVIVAGDLGTFDQNTMSGSIRPNTGLYPPLLIVNPTTITVPGGTGRIVRPGSLDQSGASIISWPTQNVVIQNLATAWSTTIGVDAGGQIVQFAGAFNPSFARENVLVGVVTHVNGVVNAVSLRPTIYGDMTYAAYDLAALFANQIVSGGKIGPNIIQPFQINVSAGVLFGLGFDSDEIDSPNSFEFPDQLNIPFFPVTGISGAFAPTQNVPVTFYDPGGLGVITAIPGGASTATIHRLYYLASGQYLFLYGQNTYADLNTALSQISVDSAATTYPAKLGSAALLGYIVAQRNTTNLNNATQARLVSKGGTDFTIGSSSSISEAPVNGIMYGRINASWLPSTPLPSGPSLTNRFIRYSTDSLARWTTGANDTPELGGDTGSNFELRSYSDAGTLTGSAMIADRLTRVVNFPAGLQIGGQPIFPAVPAVWGGIGGTLSNQTDLQAALDAKVALTGNQTVAGQKTFNDNMRRRASERRGANDLAWFTEPRVFVQATDPGAAAADGDLWIW